MPSSVASVLFLTRDDGMMSTQYVMVSSQVFSLFGVVATQVGATTLTVFGMGGDYYLMVPFMISFGWVLILQVHFGYKVFVHT